MSEAKFIKMKTVSIRNSTGLHHFGTNISYAYEFAKLLRLCGESFEWIESKSNNSNNIIKVTRKTIREVK